MGILQTADLHPQAVLNQSSTIFDDFYQYVTTQNGLTTAPAGSGSVALEASNDRALISTAATNNDFEGIRTTQAAFSFTASQAQYAETYMQYANQATTTGNIAFGFASSATLGITDGAAPSVACSALILKLDGKSVWSIYTSCNSNGTLRDSTATAVDGKYLLHIDIFNFDGLNAGVSFSVNGQVLRDSNGLAFIEKVPYASAAALYGVAQVGAGSANVQTGYFDYVSWGKNRLLTY